MAELHGPPGSDRRARVVLITLVLVGAGLRVASMGQDLFADELATYWIVTEHGLRGVIDTVYSTAEITPPLSFVLSWLAMHLGDNPALVRLPALVGGLLCIPLAYLVARRCLGARAAEVTAALVSVSPLMTYYASEGRGYGVLGALILLSTLALLNAADGGRRLWWAVYAAAACLACYTHYTGVFVLGVQLVWLLVAHPERRRAALVSTGIAVAGFAPWMPGLRGDIDSPTTRLLSILSPMNRRAVYDALTQWSVGFPAANLGWDLPHDVSGSNLGEHPGLVALALLAVGLVAGAAGTLTRVRGETLGDRAGLRRSRITLIVLLAAASPVGAAAQSIVGSNVFRTRSLVPSWPYLAMAGAALATAARPSWLRRLATASLVVGVGLSGLLALGADFQRPGFEEVRAFADEQGVGVVVNAATWTPGPLTNFDIEGGRPAAPVIRLTVPEQSEEPFWFGQYQIPPDEAARQAVSVAGNRPILLVAYVPPLPEVDAFLAALPEGYERTGTKVIRGIFRMEAWLYEPVG